MPCAFRVKANVTSGHVGHVRFQSTDRSWFEMTVTNNLASWTTDDGFLEGARAGDDDTGTLQVFAWADVGMPLRFFPPSTEEWLGYPTGCGPHDVVTSLGAWQESCLKANVA